MLGDIPAIDTADLRLDVTTGDPQHGDEVLTVRPIVVTEEDGATWEPVSYTHLTLPTKRIV